MVAGDALPLLQHSLPAQEALGCLWGTAYSVFLVGDDDIMRLACAPALRGVPKKDWRPGLRRQRQRVGNSTVSLGKGILADRRVSLQRPSAVHPDVTGGWVESESRDLD